MLVWGSVYFIVFMYEWIVSQEIKSGEMEKLAVQARLQLLQSQLNPHFLFNSLNCRGALLPG